MIFMRITNQTMSAKNKYLYQHCLANHNSVVCGTSTCEQDWKKLKDYFADAATRLNVKKVNYYVWFHVTLYFMRIKVVQHFNFHLVSYSKTSSFKYPQHLYPSINFFSIRTTFLYSMYFTITKFYSSALQQQQVRPRKLRHTAFFLFKTIPRQGSNLCS